MMASVDGGERAVGLTFFRHGCARCAPVEEGDDEGEDEETATDTHLYRRHRSWRVWPESEPAGIGQHLADLQPVGLLGTGVHDYIGGHAGVTTPTASFTSPVLATAVVCHA